MTSNLGKLLKGARSLALLLLVLGVASICKADDITYNVDLTIGAGGVTGDIITDGTIGVLGASNIVGWNLDLNDGTNTVDLTALNSVVAVFGSTVSGPTNPLSATATQLLFNFSLPATNYLLFQATIIPTDGYFCFTSTSCTSAIPAVSGYGAEQVSATSNLANFQSTTTDLSGVEAIAAVQATSTSEPSTLLMLGVGLFGLMGMTFVHRKPLLIELP